MTERTVTEAEVIAALEKLGHTAYQLTITANIMIELFPELPKVGELIKPWDTKEEPDLDRWRTFHSISENGHVKTQTDNNCVIEWLYYRRQTPDERGEG